MSWFEDERHLFAVAVALYGVASLYFIFLWQSSFRRHSHITYSLLAGGFILHTVAMVKRGFTIASCPVNNLYEAMIFIDWTIVAAYMVLGAMSRLRFLGAFAAPVLFGVGVFALMPGMDPPYTSEPNFDSPWASLHATLILLSYGAFGISCVAAVMYLSQEHNLKFHKLNAVLSMFPPIQRLEMVVRRFLVIGFGLLTMGLLVGARYLKEESGSYFSADPKIIWSTFVWLLYLGLIVMRWWFEQAGRRFAWGAVGSFAFVLLTFWGFNLLSGIHHP